MLLDGIRQVFNWYGRLSRPAGFHVIMHRVKDRDGMDYIVDEYRGRKPLTRHALPDAGAASERASQLISNPYQERSQ